MHQLKVLFSILFLFAKGSNAQSNQLGKYAISMQPLQLFCRDVPITFERIYKRSTIGLTLGYRFDSKLNENPIQQISYYAGNDFGFTAPRFKGITLGINSKLFLDKERTFYLEGQLFYRYWWFNDRMYINSTGTGADNYVYLVSGNRNVVGLKMLVGMRQSLRKIGTRRPFFYYYLGLGYRLKTEKESGVTLYTNNLNSIPNPQPYSKADNSQIPSIHLGFNFGIETFKRERAAQ